MSRRLQAGAGKFLRRAPDTGAVPTVNAAGAGGRVVMMRSRLTQGCYDLQSSVPFRMPPRGAQIAPNCSPAVMAAKPRWSA